LQQNTNGFDETVAGDVEIEFLIGDGVSATCIVPLARKIFFSSSIHLSSFSSMKRLRT
jgi:hypothetical protein